MAHFMGIDIGSATSKGVITQEGQPLVGHYLPSQANYRAAALKLRGELLAKAGLSPQDIARTITTGHSVAGLPFDHQRVADIRCCARGINRLFPQARTIIDIQAMSSRVIRLGQDGQVGNFIVSEPCAAGSGRFLEIMAHILRIDIEEIGPLSLRSQRPVHFTTSCAVFGESEAISRVAQGTPKDDILAGVHRALADKLCALTSRVGLEEPCAISGGGGLDTGLIKSLEDRLSVSLLVPAQPQLATALGAAIMAQEKEKC